MPILVFTLILAYGAFRYGAVLTADWSILAAAVGLLTAIYWIPPRQDRSPGDRLLTGLLCAVTAVAVIQVVPASFGFDSPGPTTAAFIRYGACLLALLTARDVLWRYRDRPWLCTIPIIAVSALEAALGLAQVFLGGPSAQARGTYINRNHFSGLLELGLPLAVMGGVWLARRHRKFENPAGTALQASALFGIATLALLGILFSLSRMGFLAALASLGVTGVLSLSGKGRHTRWLPACSVGLVVAAGLIVLPPPQLIARFADIAATDDVSSGTRSHMWRESTPLVAAAPIFGWGLGSYESAFMKYKTVAPMLRADFAHNDYLQALIELGLAGFLPALAIAILALGGSLHAATAKPTDPERYLGIGCTGSLIALMLHSLVDFNLYIPSNALAAAWLLGLCLGFRQLRPPRFSWRVLGSTPVVDKPAA